MTKPTRKEQHLNGLDPLNRPRFTIEGSGDTRWGISYGIPTIGLLPGTGVSIGSVSCRKPFAGETPCVSLTFSFTEPGPTGIRLTEKEFEKAEPFLSVASTSPESLQVLIEKLTHAKKVLVRAIRAQENPDTDTD